MWRTLFCGGRNKPWWEILIFLSRLSQSLLLWELIDSICISGSVTRLHELSGASWLWLVMSWRGSGLGKSHNGHRRLSTCWDQRTHWPGLLISKEEEASYFHSCSVIVLFNCCAFFYSQGYSPAVMEHSGSVCSSQGLDCKRYSRKGSHKGRLLGSAD